MRAREGGPRKAREERWEGHGGREGLGWRAGGKKGQGGWEGRGMEGQGGRDKYKYFVLLIVRFVPDDHFSWNIES